MGKTSEAVPSQPQGSKFGEFSEGVRKFFDLVVAQTELGQVGEVAKTVVDLFDLVAL